MPAKSLDLLKVRSAGIEMDVLRHAVCNRLCPGRGINTCGAPAQISSSRCLCASVHHGIMLSLSSNLVTAVNSQENS